ncbi:MAG: hypothetical protein AAF699_22405 [Pseudomonadota bacterium]
MSKTQLLKENFALVVGVSLPLLLVLVFWIATVIPKMTVADPQYDLLYTADYYDHNTLIDGAIQIEIRDGRLHAVFRKTPGFDQHNLPRIYYFDVSTGSTQELSIVIPADVKDGQELEIPEAQGLTLSKKTIAPDGYMFDADYSSRSGFLFFDSGYRYRGLIRKDGRAIKIPTQGNQYGGNLRFLAWVLENEQP